MLPYQKNDKQKAGFKVKLLVHMIKNIECNLKPYFEPSPSHASQCHFTTRDFYNRTKQKRNEWRMIVGPNATYERKKAVLLSIIDKVTTGVSPFKHSRCKLKMGECNKMFCACNMFRIEMSRFHITLQLCNISIVNFNLNPRFPICSKLFY